MGGEDPATRQALALSLQRKGMGRAGTQGVLGLLCSSGPAGWGTGLWGQGWEACPGAGKTCPGFQVWTSYLVLPAVSPPRPWDWQFACCDNSASLPRSEKQRWISAMCPSSPQEDKEVISEGEGSSLPLSSLQGPCPLGWVPCCFPPSLQSWVPCGQRGYQGGGSSGLGWAGGSAEPQRTGGIYIGQADPHTQRQHPGDGKAFYILLSPPPEAYFTS